MEIYIAIGAAAFFLATTAFAFFLYQSVKKQLDDLKNVTSLSEKELSDELELLEKQHDALLVSKTEAETRLISLQEQLAKSEDDRRQLINKNEAVIEEKNRHERDKELARQKIVTMQQQIEDWERTKKEHFEITKASVLEVGSSLSSKLLDDHKREVEAAKKENEKVVKQTTDDLHRKFQSVFESMNTLNEKVNDNTSTVDLVKRSLLSPGGAGNLAEITLENIFKASGLIENQDYSMQHWVENQGRGLRPDALVFLPANNVMVVDSKASKFFVELGEAGEDNQASISEGLKKTMNNHLKDLVSRDYQEAVQKQMSGNVNATTLMFLPSEVALEKLRKIDPKFMDKAWKERILPVGPTGLVNALLQAKILISNAKQEENSKLILGEVKDLINSVVKLHDLASAMGRGIKGVFNKYDEFAGSFNRNFLSKARKIDKLGANVPKIQAVKKLDRYKIDSREYKEIEGDTSVEEAKEFLLSEQDA